MGRWPKCRDAIHEKVPIIGMAKKDRPLLDDSEVGRLGGHLKLSGHFKVLAGGKNSMQG